MKSTVTITSKLQHTITSTLELTRGIATTITIIITTPTGGEEKEIKQRKKGSNIATHNPGNLTNNSKPCDLYVRI